MDTPMQMAKLDGMLLWYAVLIGILIMAVAAFGYTILLLTQSGKLQKTGDVEEIRERFLAYRPYKPCVNLLVSGVSIGIIAWLTQMTRPALPEEWLPYAYAFPLVVAGFGSLAIFMGIHHLKSEVEQQTRDMGPYIDNNPTSG